MLVSLEWLGDFVRLPSTLGIKQLAHDLTLCTVEVEGYWSAARRIGDHVVVGVVHAVDGDGADWSVTLDIGGDAMVSAQSSGPMPVGIATAVALDDAGASICTPIDLDVSDMYPGASHLPLDLSEVGSLTPGSSVAAALGLNDLILEIDNKSLTNRPDLWGHLGIARELAAIYRAEFIAPPAVGLDTALENPELIGEVDPTFCHRFTLVTIDCPAGAHGASPLPIRSRLVRMGQRSLGLYADLTNYAMFAIGQPSHTYDGADISLPISVRRGPAGPMPSLTGETLQLTRDSGVIADVCRTVALAGVVGGTETQMTGKGTSVVLEVACFNPVDIRRASLALGVRTDASSRFEKGLDTQAVDRARGYLIHLIKESDPTATITAHADWTGTPTASTKVHTTVSFLNARMGTSLSPSDICALLRRLSFEATADGDELTIISPTWRSTGDISIPNDILEEVARMIGYDELPPSTPHVELRRPTYEGRLPLERRLREFFAFRCQAQEVLTYPWASARLLTALEFDPTDGVRIEGAPSQDCSTLRPSLVPNLLGAVEVNLPHRSHFRLFEIGTVYETELGPLGDRDQLPNLPRRLAAAFVGSTLSDEFRSACGAIEGARRVARITDLELAPRAEGGWGDPIASREIVSAGISVGRLAAIDITTVAGAHTDRIAVFFEFELSTLSQEPSRHNTFATFSSHPGASVDLSVLVSDAVSWADIATAAAAAAIPHVRTIRFVDEYRGDSIGAGRRSVTLRLYLSSHERTLVAADKAEAKQLVADRLRAVTGAELRE